MHYLKVDFLTSTKVDQFSYQFKIGITEDMISRLMIILRISSKLFWCLFEVFFLISLPNYFEETLIWAQQASLRNSLATQLGETLQASNTIIWGNTKQEHVSNYNLLCYFNFELLWNVFYFGIRKIAKFKAVCSDWSRKCHKRSDSLLSLMFRLIIINDDRSMD